MFRLKLLYITSFSLLAIFAASCGNDPNTAKKKASEMLVSPTLAQIDTQRPINPAPAPRPLKTPDVQTDYGKLPGPKGFVIRDHAILRTAPKEKSSEIGKLKKDESIYLLETTMLNEAGEQTPYPTWYKIERENKQKGWVVATAIDAGGGG